MALTWSGRRKAIYFGAFCFVALAAGVYAWTKYFDVPPTCFDGRQDGTETGVDCGGTCSLLCANAAQPLRVDWARAFQNGPSNIYTAAALVENENGNAAARAVHYIFQLYDANNLLVTEKEGVIDIPPVEAVPIVEPTIDVGNRVVAHVQFSFNDSDPIVWNTVPLVQIPHLHVTTQQLSADGTRLTATIENDSLFDAPNVTVVAILYDANGVARAASKSLIPDIGPTSSTNVTFTWPMSHSGIVRTDISILPSF